MNFINWAENSRNRQTHRCMELLLNHYTHSQSAFVSPNTRSCDQVRVLRTQANFCWWEYGHGVMMQTEISSKVTNIHPALILNLKVEIIKSELGHWGSGVIGVSGIDAKPSSCLPKHVCVLYVTTQNPTPSCRNRALWQSFCIHLCDLSKFGCIWHHFIRSSEFNLCVSGAYAEFPN